jgi:REP element-mobilizing transposase RayT
MGRTIMTSVTPAKHNRRSVRLPDYDYSKPGAYFITICVRNRECLFGEIINGEMRLNEFGEIVSEKWLWLAQQYLYIKLDEFVVMPNHFHGILWIRDIARWGGSRPAPTQSDTFYNDIKIKPVGQLIGVLKTVSAKQVNIARNTVGFPVWQRDFYDHIGHNENELIQIRQYIRNNPSAWDNDNENPVLKSPWYVAMPNPQ